MTKKEAYKAVIKRGYVTKEEEKIIWDKKPDYTKVHITFPSKSAGIGGESPWAIGIDETRFIFSNDALMFLPLRSWGFIGFHEDGEVDLKKTVKPIIKHQKAFLEIHDRKTLKHIDRMFEMFESVRKEIDAL